MCAKRMRLFSQLVFVLAALIRFLCVALDNDICVRCALYVIVCDAKLLVFHLGL